MVNGVLAPLTTPFSETGEVAYDAFRENLVKYLANGPILKGFLALGTTGESSHLLFEEKQKLLEIAADSIPSSKDFLVGVGPGSSYEILDFLDQIAGIRIDGILLSTPSYYKSRMDETVLIRYFLEIADRSPFPILLYNIPQFSGIELDVSLVKEVAEHPNIVGMKESSGNVLYLQELLLGVEGLPFQVVSGSAETFGLATLLGVEAGILAIGCALPELADAVLEARDRGLEQLKRAQSRLFRVSSVVVRRLSVPGVKYTMDLCGYSGLFCRPPLRGLSEAERAVVKSVIQETSIQ